MFTVESLPPQYCEDRAAERAAAEAAKRHPTHPQPLSAASLTAHNRSFSSAASVASSSSSQPSALHRSMLHRPTLSRTGSGGFLGNILQGFAKNAAAAGTGGGARAVTPCLVSPAASEKSEAEAMTAAEAKRDLEICTMRPW